MTENGHREMHAAGADDDDDGGLKDMDVAMDCTFSAAFCDDMNRQVQQAVMTSTVGGHDREIWFGRDQDNLLDHVNHDVNDSAMFYTDFPPLPDFPCMSSSSSSSSAPVNSKPGAATSSSSSASSSSATSWTVFKAETEEYNHNSEKKRHHRHYEYDELVDAASGAAFSSTSSTMKVNLPPVPHGSNTNNRDVDCMNENFGYMDLLDSSDIWDPSSIFESENPQQYDHQEEFFKDKQQPAAAGLMNSSQVQDPNYQQQQPPPRDQEKGNDGLYFLQGNSEMGAIFLEWLKQNKDYISPEDMRSIKLKRSTIDCASKRLGSTKEGKKQLLKLILEWVEQYQLQKKRDREIGPPADSPYQYPDETINPNPNADLNCNPVPSPDPNTCFPHSSTWVSPQPPVPCVQESGPMMAVPAAAAAAAFPPIVAGAGGGYMCDIPYSSAAPNQSVNGNLYPPTSTDQYQPPQMGSPQAWNIAPTTFAMGSHSQYNQFPDDSTTNVAAVAGSHAQAMYVNPYPYPVFDGNTGVRLVRLGSSATKEARKKRMARQRRITLHQYRHHHHNNHHQNQPQNLMMNEQVHAAAVVEECTSSQANPPGNWIFWPPAAPPASSMALVPPVVEASSHAQTQPAVDRGTMQPQNHQQRSHQVSADRKQGWKTEKNLKFLLQKVLKQSDVGNLGRIVLPKKEAETHLPELESRDGIPLAMEDIGTSNVWNMRYRFWPNNKSRMYLLENTGDFVRVNGLQEGDFIVIYSDTKCGKYLIRGVKVRQPGSKSEAKKPAKKNQRNVPQPAANFSLSSCKQTVK